MLLRAITTYCSNAKSLHTSNSPPPHLNTKLHRNRSACQQELAINQQRAGSDFDDVRHGILLAHAKFRQKLTASIRSKQVLNIIMKVRATT